MIACSGGFEKPPERRIFVDLGRYIVLAREASDVRGWEEFKVSRLTQNPGERTLYLEAEIEMSRAVEARARYLALASAVAADVRPLPEAGWSRVDLDDLPPSLREAFSSVDLAAAWRLTSPPAEARVAVSLLPPASSLPLLVKRRDTTSLLTVDGTLLHREGTGDR